MLPLTIADRLGLIRIKIRAKRTDPDLAALLDRLLDDDPTALPDVHTHLLATGDFELAERLRAISG